MRFALLEAKLALANIVRRYILHPSTKTVEPYILDPKSGISYVKDGLFVQLEKRNIEIDEFYVVDWKKKNLKLKFNSYLWITTY